MSKKSTLNHYSEMNSTQDSNLAHFFREGKKSEIKPPLTTLKNCNFSLHLVALHIEFDTLRVIPKID